MSVSIVTNRQLPAAKAILNPTPPEIEFAKPDRLQEIKDAVDALADEAAAMATMRELLARQTINCFEQGGVLYKLKNKGWFGAHDSFEALCSAEFRIEKFAAFDLAAMFVKMMGDNVPWTTVKELGSSILLQICGWLVINDLSPEVLSNDFEELKTMTALEVQQALKKLEDCEPFLHENHSEIMADGPGGNEPAAPDIDDKPIMAWLQHAGPDKARELVEVALPGWTVAKCAPS